MFLSGLRALFAPAGMVLMLFFIVGQFAYEEFHLEKKFQLEYGADWKPHFEEQHGSVQERRTKIVVGAASLVVVSVLTVLIYRQFVPAHKRRGY